MTANRHIAGHGDRNIAEVNNQNRLLVDAGNDFEQRIDNGEVHYAMSLVSASLADSTIRYLIRAPTTHDMHLFPFAYGNKGLWEVNVRQGFTVSNNGSPLVARNRKFGAAAGVLGQIFSNPTVSGATVILQGYGSSENRFPDAFTRKWLLPANTDMEFFFINRTGESAQFNFSIDFYETPVS